MSELIPIPSPGVPLLFGRPGSPAVVVVHDGYGRLPWLTPYAETLASRGGFRVIVPDLYHGVATDDEHEADVLLDQLSGTDARAAIIREIAAARAEGSARAGVVGFAMGGGLALQVAQAGEVDAAVAYYATLQATQPGIIPCPVMLHFAEEDDWPETGSPEPFVSRLRENGTPVTQHGYAGTEHGFANASLPALLDTRAAALAGARTAVFLETHLGD
ncbi:MAG TPA: alpha/beta fold hydrolase [Pseudolysinimonas sp.]|nr:alpha/beta fold hydrolase [Pseudolysinimonas sp.]